MADPDDVDALIAGLAAEGELDSVGVFTLDLAVALAKLREHQLADPTRFVLAWVRAAVQLGAREVDVEIDADDLVVRFEAEPLTDAELDGLWAAAIGGRGSARVHGCRELALGIHGAFAWAAKRVVVTSGARRVELDRDFVMRCETRAPAEPGTSGETRFHAKRPLGFDLFRRKLLDGRGELPEELLLARACARARLPIRLDGRRLDVEQLEHDDAWIRLEIDDDDGRRGAVVLREDALGCAWVLVAGVEIAVVELPHVPRVELVIDDPLLPLDLSQDKPVEGGCAAWLDPRARCCSVATVTASPKSGCPPRGVRYGSRSRARSRSRSSSTSRSPKRCSPGSHTSTS